MALVKTDNMLAQIQGFSTLPAVRQVGLMVMLAATIALGVAVVLWAQTPNYSILYGNLSAGDLAEVAGALDAANAPYKIEHASGSITVPSNKVHDLRIRLATRGMPKSQAAGYELLEKEQAFGTSRFLEKARFQQALEGELARSISSLDGVEQARVHLAIPKESVFVRDRIKPAASVLLKLHGGRSLDKSQIAGIVHLVAASVPKMQPEGVTVVDQQGRMLSEKASDTAVGLSNAQLEYTRQLEETYVQRIQDILSPFVGTSGIRAQVVADLDFTTTELTRESYVPEKTLVRSEDIREEKNNLADPMGVPGALTNKPPRKGSIDNPVPAESAENNASSSRHVIRNFELDRTITHSRQAPGHVRRLSVAVVVDYRKKFLDAGQVETVALTGKELEHVTALVKEAVGFDASRNDSVEVINIPFQSGPQMEPVAELPIWQQPWVLELAKPVLGGLFVLWLAFGILRPTLKNLAQSGQFIESGANGEVLLAGEGGAVAGLPTPDGEAGSSLQDLPLQEDEVVLSNDAQQAQAGQEKRAEMVDIDTARSMVQQDPKRVAQVVKTWVADDE